MSDARPGYNYQSIHVSGRAYHLEVCYISWAYQSIMVQWLLSPTTQHLCQWWHQLFSFHERRTSQTVGWVITEAACISGAVHIQPFSL